MANSAPNFFARIFIAFGVFFKYIFSRDFAAGVTSLSPTQETTSAIDEAPQKPAPATLQEAGPDSALQLLGLLQRDGRFIDFIQEDVSAFSDADIGAAARVVHEGCRKVIQEHFTIDAERSEEEGTRITLEKGFDASAVRVVGNVVGEPPFSGTLTHRGWHANDVRLPKITAGHDVNILAAAEVEL